MYAAFLCTVLALLWVSCSPAALVQPPVEPTSELHFEIDPDVEFMGFIYHLSGLGRDAAANDALVQTERGEVPESAYRAVGVGVYEQYRAYEDSPTLAAVLERAGAADLSALLALFRGADPVSRPGSAYAVPDDLARSLFPSSDSARARAQELAGLIADFAREVPFDAVLSERRACYDSMLAQVRASSPDPTLLALMESFYRQDFDAYVLVPSLLLPAGMAFGPKDVGSDGTRVYNVFGPMTAQAVGRGECNPGFDSPVRLFELTVHEFGHSFVNHVVSDLPPSLVAGAEHRYGAVADAMRRQGYTNWETVLQEHFVRSGEVLLTRMAGRPSQSEALLRDYVKDRGFAYIPLVVPYLERYAGGHYGSYAEAVAAAVQGLSE